jgi:hypothetical protein
MPRCCVDCQARWRQTHSCALWMPWKALGRNLVTGGMHSLVDPYFDVLHVLMVRSTLHP